MKPLNCPQITSALGTSSFIVAATASRSGVSGGDSLPGMKLSSSISQGSSISFRAHAISRRISSAD